MYQLEDPKYTETEYHIFQSIEIEMAKSEEDELCLTPNSSADILDLELMQQEPSSIFSWNLVKHRQRPHRRYTVSHSSSAAPPAPPSTPTSLTATGTTLTPSPTSVSATDDDKHLNRLLYILDYAPKYKKKLKEQRRTDLELAELLNVFTISGSSSAGGSTKSINELNSSKVPPERGISDKSRVIRKNDARTKIFKIHRNPKEFFREPDEDSVSAPEYDTEEEDTRYRRFARLKPCKRLLMSKRLRRLARFEHGERMDSIVDNFDAAMNINEEEA